MGASNSKVDTMCLDAQGGKTRRIQDLIEEENDACKAAHVPRPLNIVFQANNRSLVDQTGARMEDELFKSEVREDAADDAQEADMAIEGGVLSWHSGGKTKVTPAQVGLKIFMGDIEMLVCCANRRRLTYVADIVRDCAKAQERGRFAPKINFWFDEADSYVSFFKDTSFKEIAALPIVAKITMVTATVDALIQTFGSINVLPMETTTLPMYVGLADYAVELVPDRKDSAADFIKAAVERNVERYLAPGVRIFAPGAVKRASHYAIAASFLELGAAVVVLNGMTKEIWVPNPAGDKEVIALPRSCDTPRGQKELGKIIACLYETHDLKRFPLAITGNICLGRGITFQNAGFLFDHMILPPVFDTRAGAYQAAGRGLGNIRELLAFVERAATGFKPTLVTTKCTHQWLKEAASIAGSLAKNAHATGRRIVTKDDLDVAAGYKDLGKSEVPLAFALPASLAKAIVDEKNTAKWSKTVLDALKDIAPALHKQLTTGEWVSHINTYNMQTGISNYKANYRKVRDAAREGRRAHVPCEEWRAAQKNIWYASVDLTPGELTPKQFVVCRYMGAQ